MWTKHLATGSNDPPRTEGHLRIYSNTFCPFAQRDLLVLRVKNILHEVVNINLINKPEWLFQYNPKGLVPILVDGSKIVTESLDIADYLDEKFPEPPLYPADPEGKKRDQEVIKNAGPVMDLFIKTLISQDNDKTPQEIANLFLEKLQSLEDELKQRGTKYFSGEKPGMIDFMIWPWAERADCLSLKFGQKLPLKETDIVLLRKWRKTMMELPVCQSLLVKCEPFLEVIKCKVTGIAPEYDELAEC